MSGFDPRPVTKIPHSSSIWSYVLRLRRNSGTTILLSKSIVLCKKYASVSLAFAIWNLSVGRRRRTLIVERLGLSRASRRGDTPGRPRRAGSPLAPAGM